MYKNPFRKNHPCNGVVLEIIDDSDSFCPGMKFHDTNGLSFGDISKEWDRSDVMNNRVYLSSRKLTPVPRKRITVGELLNG